MNTNNYPSVGSIMTWAKAQEVNYLQGNMTLPYVKKDNMFYYFGKRENGYSLLMSSIRDLEEM